MQVQSKCKNLLAYLGLILAILVLGAGVPACADEHPQRVTIGGKEMAQRLKVKVEPVYPEKAKEYKIQGVVKLHVIVGTDGRIQQIQVVSGHPLLVGSALDAVRQWAYEPVNLHGRPIEVDTEVDVIFQFAKKLN